MNKYKTMTDDFLKRMYVPDVYQPSIYAIDYQKLKDAGIKLISFDIDDTIADLLKPDPSSAATVLFTDLKNMGFDLMLLSNTHRENRAKHFAEKLGIEGCWIAKAEKPGTVHFQAMKDKYQVELSQMAHVGNNLREDVGGGNSFGITTCYVRREGVTAGLPKRIPGYRTQGQELRKELKKRNIWRKHHKKVEGDQYYQLGEIPPYRRS